MHANSIDSLDYRLYKLQTTNGRLYTLQTLHSTDSTLYKLYRLQTLHSTDSTLYKLYRLQTLQTTDSTLYRLYTLQTLHTTDSTLYRLYTLQTLHFTNSTDYRLCKLQTLQTLQNPQTLQPRRCERCRLPNPARNRFCSLPRDCANKPGLEAMPPTKTSKALCADRSTGPQPSDSAALAPKPMASGSGSDRLTH
jgi:hypothetical protein